MKSFTELTQLLESNGRKPLLGHDSLESAYVVDDYPYGFRLRCKMRYWLEFNPSKGFRLWSQTSNPKMPTLVWNKPKSSTYTFIAAFLFLDTNDHVDWDGLNEYSSTPEAVKFRDDYYSFLSPVAKSRLDAWIKKKTEFDAKLASGEIKITTKVVTYSPK